MRVALVTALLLGILTSVAHTEDPVHVSAYYYPWYDSNGLHWDEGYARGGPMLGKYSSRSTAVINEHLDWSEQFGIDSWICAWWGPRSWEDITIRTAIMPELNKRSEGERKGTKFCLLYESGGLLGLNPEEGIHFTTGRISKFVSDFEFIASRYFNHPAYLKVDGRPVVYLYLTRTFTGDYATAIQMVREKCRTLGFDVFLVGDEVYWGEPDIFRIREFDGITAYNMHGPEVFASLTDWTEFIEECEAVFDTYRQVATENEVAFFPGILPGFDASGTGATYYQIPRKIQKGAPALSTLKAMAEMAKRTLDPTHKHIAVTSFNEWHEGTQLEPSTDEISKEEFFETMEIFSSLKRQ